MTATAEDVAGNVSALAPIVPLVILTTAPEQPTLALDAASRLSPGLSTQTNREVVNLTGTTSGGMYVALTARST